MMNSATTDTNRSKRSKKAAKKHVSYNEEEHRQWLERLLATAEEAPHGQIMRLETITPERAQYLLDKRNPANRKTQEERIHTMGLDMVHHRWLLNGDTVVIANDGNLNNGQHRMEAIVVTELPLLTWLCVGPTREARTTHDIGIAKSAADFAAMEGYDNARKRSAAASTLLTYENRVSARKTTKIGSRKALFDYIVAHDDELNEGLQLAPAKGFPGMTPGRLVAIAVILRRAGANPDAIRFYLNGLAVGNDLPKGSPILYARNRIMRLAKDASQVGHDQRMELVWRTWNLWREGREISSSGLVLSGKLHVELTP